jgi:hypothetical protein
MYASRLRKRGSASSADESGVTGAYSGSIYAAMTSTFSASSTHGA